MNLLKCFRTYVPFGLYFKTPSLSLTLVQTSHFSFSTMHRVNQRPQGFTMAKKEVHECRR
jgi:hypothetical protein